MDDLTSLLIALAILLALSAFFSLSETAMMASSRHKLQHLAKTGHRGARLTLALLAQTDRLLGAILLGNSLTNAGIAVLISFITFMLWGSEQWVLVIAVLITTFAILIFSEIGPQIIGTLYADKISKRLGFILTPLVWITFPAIWTVNLISRTLLRIFGMAPRSADRKKLTHEELRTLILESRELIPAAHSTILTNLLDLGMVYVEDVMTPRGSIEILDLEASWDEIISRINNNQHSRLPVCRESLDQLLGVLPLRHLMPELQEEDFDKNALLEHLIPPYYIPIGTPLLTQLGFFRENRQRSGFVVDEYGEIQGLVTLEDIVEEIFGEFSTSLPGSTKELCWDANGSTLLEGSLSLREINRKLGLDFPLDGPKTLNGLILEYFEDIPEPGISLKLHGIPVEIIRSQDRSVKIAKLYRPLENTSK